MLWILAAAPSLPRTFNSRFQSGCVCVCGIMACCQCWNGVVLAFARDSEELVDRRVRTACTFNTRYTNGMACITHTCSHIAHTYHAMLEASYRMAFYLYSRYACVQYVFSSVSESIVFLLYWNFSLFKQQEKKVHSLHFANILLELILFLGKRNLF